MSVEKYFHAMVDKINEWISLNMIWINFFEKLVNELPLDVSKRKDDGGTEYEFARKYLKLSQKNRHF